MWRTDCPYCRAPYPWASRKAFVAYHNDYLANPDQLPLSTRAQEAHNEVASQQNLRATGEDIAFALDWLADGTPESRQRKSDLRKLASVNSVKVRGGSEEDEVGLLHIVYEIVRQRGTIKNWEDTTLMLSLLDASLSEAQRSETLIQHFGESTNAQELRSYRHGLLQRAAGLVLEEPSSSDVKAPELAPAASPAPVQAGAVSKERSNWGSKDPTPPLAERSAWIAGIIACIVVVLGFLGVSVVGDDDERDVEVSNNSGGVNVGINEGGTVVGTIVEAPPTTTKLSTFEESTLAQQAEEWAVVFDLDLLLSSYLESDGGRRETSGTFADFSIHEVRGDSLDITVGDSGGSVTDYSDSWAISPPFYARAVAIQRSGPEEHRACGIFFNRIGDDPTSTHFAGTTGPNLQLSEWLPPNEEDLVEHRQNGTISSVVDGISSPHELEILVRADGEVSLALDGRLLVEHLLPVVQDPGFVGLFAQQKTQRAKGGVRCTFTEFELRSPDSR